MRDCIFVCTEPSGAAAQATLAGPSAGGDPAKLSVPWHFDQVRTLTQVDLEDLNFDLTRLGCSAG